MIPEFQALDHSQLLLDSDFNDYFMFLFADFIVFITDEIAHETSIVETIDLNL